MFDSSFLSSPTVKPVKGFLPFEDWLPYIATTPRQTI